MKIYKCIGKAVWDSEENCDCEYREVAKGVWEFRYVGDGYHVPEDREWSVIEETSLAEIKKWGHLLKLVENDENKEQ